MGENIFYVDNNKKKNNTAGAKAPDDIASLCLNAGYTPLIMPTFPSGYIQKKIWLATRCVFFWWKVLKTLPIGAFLIYQHPIYGIRIAEKMIPRIQKEKNIKCVCLIHDLNSLRGDIAGVAHCNKKTAEIADNVLLKHFDIVICHNEHMRQYMIEQGFAENRLINLEIFDYLTDCKMADHIKNSKPTIAIAGNLASEKCGYIYDIVHPELNKNTGLIINLYGVNYDQKKASNNMVYKGSFNPEELPGILDGDFGLVWDGPVAKTCAGNSGEYLRYNNPHKTSLYLVAGIPVIVWSQAAIADFVIKNGVGITVDRLENLEESIRLVSNISYARMCENVKRIGKKLADGYYFKNAIKVALGRE